MKKITIAILLVSIFILQVFTISNLPGTYARKTKIAILTDVYSGHGDVGWGDLAFKGGEDAAKAFGVEVMELVSHSDWDYVLNLEAAAKDKDVILIIVVGWLFADALGWVASEYPDKNFAWIDGCYLGQDCYLDMDNVMTILFEEHEGSAIVGAIATLTAAYYNYEHVGTVLGVEIPALWKFEIGYKWGVRWAMDWYTKHFDEPFPDIVTMPQKERVLWEYTGTFSNIRSGYDSASWMYADNAVAVYNIAGPLGFGIDRAVREIATSGGRTAGPPFSIGVDTNWDWVNPGFVLVSMMKRLDRAVYLATQLTLEGKFTPRVVVIGIGTTISGIAVEGVSVSTLADLDDFIKMGIAAKKWVGHEVLPMSPTEIRSKVEAMRNALPTWVWDAANELEAAIRSDPTLVPLAATTEDVDYWRSILG
jgi:basic membrane protein A